MDSSIEPGLLDTFRSLLKIQGIILLAALVLQLLDTRGTVLVFLALYLLHTIFLALLLKARMLPGFLGRAYLPLVLLAAAVGPGLCHAAAIMVRLLSGFSGEDAVLDPGGLTLWLLPTLLMFSSQYRFKTVALFTAGTAVLDLTIAGLFSITGGPPLQPTLQQVTTRSLIYLLIGYVVTRFSSAQRSIRQDLAGKNAQLVDFAATREQLAITRERNRMARELHDTLAHTLTALSVQLQAAEVLVQRDPPAASRQLEKLSEDTRAGIQEVRRAMHALRAAPLEDLGLVQALDRLAHSAASRAGCELKLDLPHELPDCSTVHAQNMFRIAEETLNNIVQHARASTISLELAQSEKGYRLVIRDDGIGFNPSTVPEGHFGITGIQERASLCGGAAELHSAPQEGTIWTIQIP